jgi:hypothetical protein
VGGGWTSTRPTGSAIVQVLGIVTKEGMGGQGLVLNPGPANLPNLPSGSVWVGNSGSVPVAIPTASLNVASASYALTASFALNGGGGSTIKAGSGSVASFGGSPLTSSITFGSAFTDNSYAISITGEDARSWTIQSKTSAGFTINSNSSVGLIGPVYWMATPFGS